MSQPAPGGCKPFLLHWWAVLLFACILLSLCFTIAGLRPGRIINELDGIVAISPQDVWAVGFSTTLTGRTTLVEHWTGRWNLIASPGRDTASILESVAASSSRDVWAVGKSYHSYIAETLIEHWDGISWQIVPSPKGPGSNSLRSVAVVSTTDAWAVGATDSCPSPPTDAVPIRQGNALARARPVGHAAACTAPEQPLIEHWDGHTWSIATNASPEPQLDEAWLSQVTAFAWNDVWAIGNSLAPPDGAALIEHWDGSAWKVIHDPRLLLQGDFQVVALLSSNDIWGAGSRTIAQQYDQPVMNHWNGSAWSKVAGPPYGTGAYIVGTMTASAADDVWVGGNHEPPGQNGYQDEVFAMHWNGQDWRLVPTPAPGGGFIEMKGSTSLSAHDAWMVGRFYAWNDDQYSFIEHWDGQVWSLVPNPNPGWPVGIFHFGTP